jgi:FHIPEP family
MRTNDDTPLGLSPEIEVWLELGSDLSHFADSFESTLLARGLASELDALLGRLGLDGQAIVRVRRVQSRRPLRVRVHGALLAYSPQMLTRAWLSVAPPELHDLPVQGIDRSSPDFPWRWLGTYAAESADVPPPDLQLVRAALERLAAQLVVERPSCLLGPAQVDAYAKALDLGRDRRGLPLLMSTLLDRGVPLRNHELVRRVIDEGAELERPFEDTIEAAFTELRSHDLEIQIHPDTLQELVPRAPERESFSVYDPRVDQEKRDLFQDLERTFFSAFGFLLPGLRWAPSTAIEPGKVAVRLGAWRGLPAPTLPGGERLVLDRAEDLRARGVKARPAVNPATGMPCALVDTSLKETLEGRGLITWGPVDFVLVVLISDLARRAGTLLGMEDVEYQLAELPAEAEELLPEPARTALTLFSLGDLTRVLRALVEERLSLRDLGGLLERLVQYDTIPVPDDDAHLLLLDYRLPVPRAPQGGNGRGAQAKAGWRSYYAFLRRQLAPYLSYFHAMADRRIYVYALDRETEELARNSPAGFDDDALESLADAVRAQLARSPASVTVIATTTRARQTVRDMLAPEFPDLPVLAYAELSPEFEVERLGEIGAFTGVPHGRD